MANRAQRRAQAKKERANQKHKRPSYHGLSQELMLEKLCQNGITPKDLEKEYSTAIDKGFKAGEEATFKTVYAAMALALHELYGFGRERCWKVLVTADNKIVEYLTANEIIEDVWKKMHLRINFHEPFDRIEEDAP